MGSVYLAAIFIVISEQTPSHNMRQPDPKILLLLWQGESSYISKQVALAIYPQKYIFLCVTKLTVSFVSQKETQVCWNRASLYLVKFCFLLFCLFQRSSSLFFVIQTCGSPRELLLMAFLNVVFFWWHSAHGREPHSKNLQLLQSADGIRTICACLYTEICPWLSLS